MTKQTDIQNLHRLECNGCKFRECWTSMKNPHMEPWGPENAVLYVLGEAPTENDDQTGRSFSAGLGKSFRNMMDSVGLPEARFNYVTRCRKPEGEKVTWRQIEPCRPSIERDIQTVRPKVLLAVGAAALEWIEPEGSISKWYGKPFAAKVGEHEFWVIPVLDLFNMVAKYAAEPTREIYRTLQTAKQVLQENKVPKVHRARELDQFVTTCLSLRAVQEVIDQNPPDFSKLVNDVETTGLDPKKDKVLTMAFTYMSAQGRLVTVTVPIHHPENLMSEQDRWELVEYLGGFHSQFRIVVFHNATFDVRFLFGLFGERVWNWNIRCTQAMSYVLDTHSGIHSLDICTRLHLGIVSFKEDSAIDVTNLINEPLTQVLCYNGRDSTATFLLETKLSAQLAKLNLFGTYEFHCRRLRSLSQMMLRGAPLNQEEVQAQKKLADAAVAKLWMDIMTDARVTSWREEKGKEFNPESPPQVKALFVSQKLIGKDDSTDQESLGHLKDPLAKWILDYRSEIRRARFFAGLVESGATVHSSFKHTSTTTARLSSSEINLQNIEKGPPRQIIQAPPGHVLVGVDYKQLEACVIADTAQDKFLMDAIRNGLDIHAASAKELIALHPPLGGKDGIVLRDPEKFDKFRGVVKNGWVFPAFYLASVFSLAGYMDMPKNKAEVYAETFWARYAGVKRWQQRTTQQYQMTGTVWGPTGRRYTGIMTPNDLANWQIQGAASDIVVEAQNRCNAAGLISNINVHDELVFVVARAEVTEFVDKLVKIMLTHPRETGCTNFEWLKTPLSISVEIGIDWAAMTKDHPTGMREIGSYTANWS